MDALKRGDFVRVERGDQSIRAMVGLASNNGRSLMLLFDGLLRDSSGGGFAGMMPVLQDDGGVYRDLVSGEPVTIVLEA